MRSNCSF